jgi:hypothetical protein
MRSIIQPFILLLSAIVIGQTYEGGFSTPIWDTSARWEVTRLGGSGGPEMFLEGQSKGAGSNSFSFSYTEAGTAGPGYLNREGGRNFIGWFDLNAKRLHAVAGSGYGYLDGPFSRARFGLWHYTWHPGAALSMDGRYLYMTDLCGPQHSLRKLDFVQQEVSTLIPNLSTSYRGVATDSSGKIYVVSGSCMLIVLTSDGLIEKTVQLDTADGKITGFTSHSLGITIDEVHNRMYCNQSTKNWYVFYWDLSDLSFHGVVPVDSVRRWKDVPGPFAGTGWYFEGGHLSFGPDDPEKRFLYTARNDTWEIFRLDLERKWVASVRTEGGTKGQPLILSFVDTLPTSKIGVYGSFRWVGNGSFLSGGWGDSQLYKRIR